MGGVARQPQRPVWVCEGSFLAPSRDGGDLRASLEVGVSLEDAALAVRLCVSVAGSAAVGFEAGQNPLLSNNVFVGDLWEVSLVPIYKQLI